MWSQNSWGSFRVGHIGGSGIHLLLGRVARRLLAAARDFNAANLRFMVKEAHVSIGLLECVL